MKKRRHFPIVLVISFFIAGGGCGSPPTEELMQAEAALQAAKAEGAEDFVPNDFKAAAAALSDAKSKTESKDYEAALEAALDAKQKADMAKAKIGPEKLKMRGEIETTLVMVSDEWAALMSQAKKRRVKRKTKQMVDATREGFAALITDVQTKKEAEDYMGAMQSLKEARSTVSEVKSILEGK